MEQSIDEKLFDLVDGINKEGVFKVALDWAFDGLPNNPISQTYGILTCRWAGQQHAFEVSSESKDELYSYLDIISMLSGFKGVI